MVQAIERQVESTLGKKPLTIAACVKDLRQLPSIVPDNDDYDLDKLVAQLCAVHESGKSTFGVDIYNEKIGDMLVFGLGKASIARFVCCTV